MYTVGFDTSALDESFKAHARRGIGRYVRELWAYFTGARDLPVAVTQFNHALLKGHPIVERAVSCLPLGRQTVRQQIVYPFALSGAATHAAHVLHFPAHMDAPGWCPKPFMVTVLDLIPLVCGDLYKADHPDWRFKLGRFLEMRSIRAAKVVLAISEHTARDVARELGIAPERIVVTPLGVDGKFFAVHKTSADDEAALRARLCVPPQRKVILYVGGIDPRKNWRTLLASMEALSASGGPAPLLVMAGDIKGDREYPKLLAHIERSGLSAHVRLTGFLPDEELLRLYGISSAFVFPSLYEGFGLTPLEALAAGVPVVSSNASAMPEVLGDAALLVDARDARQIAEALRTVLDNPAKAAEGAEKGRQRARLFSWERTGRATVGAYERFAKGEFR